MKKLFGASIVLVCLGLLSVAHATTTVSATFETPVYVQTSISTSGCCTSPGPTIPLQEASSLSGMRGKLLFETNVIFANSVNLVHENTQSTTVSVVLIPPGQTITIAKQPSLGGVGGNPWIFLQFTDGKGNVVSDSFLLGRCVQLSK